MENSAPLSLSALLADESYDHTGRPIPVEYRKLWITKASANRNGLGRLGQEDLAAIRQVIAPAAMKWEMEEGTIYHHHQSPIHHRHLGLVEAKIVPIELNLGEGGDINSFTGEKALMNHDFTVRSPTSLATVMPAWFNRRHFKRWRIYDSHHRLKKSYPAHYLVWQSHMSKSLYARIPKPLKGMSRAASCDHCRIHDPELAEETIEYFDDRRHVDGIREMSAAETAITPFSLCRFHWWYVCSGELLRPSHVHALEMLVGGDLFERWGISHMREFLDSMSSLTPEKLVDDDADNAQPRRKGPLLLSVTKSAVPQRAKKSKPPNVPPATAANTEEEQPAPGGQQAGTATADGPDAIGATDQSLAKDLTGVLQTFISSEQNRMAELASADPGDRTDTARRGVFGLALRAYNRTGLYWSNIIDGFLRTYKTFPAPQRTQETIEPAIQQSEGDTQTTGGVYNPPSVTSSAQTPESHDSGALEQVEPPQRDGQTNGTPAQRDDGLMYSPPLEPRAMRRRRRRGNYSGRNSTR
jgi:hypothetical protein